MGKQAEPLKRQYTKGNKEVVDTYKSARFGENIFSTNFSENIYRNFTGRYCKKYNIESQMVTPCLSQIRVYF